jgi:copper transport protein
MRVRSIISAIAAALFVLVATATGALAHAGLIGALPAEGSIVETAPETMVLTFTEPVSPLAFSLVGVGGAPAALAATSVDGAVVTIGLPSGLKTGSYLFSWRVTSEDGHPVNGTVDFSVGAASGPIAAPATDLTLATAIWAARALQYFALFLGVGSLAFGGLVPAAGAIRRTATGLVVVGLVLVPIAIGLQGLDLLGLPLPALVTLAPWTEAFASPYMQTEALLAVAFALALVPSPAVAIAAALVGAVAPTLSGHASTASPQLLMRGAVFVHMASLMFWLGALAPLGVALARNDTQLLKRFSRLIPWIIAALLLSGLTLALVQLGPPEPDWLSPYGLLLGAKLVLVAALLLLALWNRVRLTARATSGATAPLRRSIVVELVLVVMILGIVAGWRFTPPPRVLAEIAAANAPVSAALSAEGATGTLTATPGRPGMVAIDITLSVKAQAVTVALANPGAAIATISRPATAADERWHVDNVPLPVGGQWTVQVAARTGKFDLKTLKGTLAVPTLGTETGMPSTKLATAALASSMLLTAPVAAQQGLLPSCPLGQSFIAGAITVSGAYARATPPAAQSAGAYLSISNSGDADDILLSASTPAAADAMLHSTKMNGQVMEMAPMPDGLKVPAHGSAALDPMHAHLMMTGMSAPFVQGQCLEMVLHFANAGDLPIQVVVGSFGQRGPVLGDPAAAPASSEGTTGGMSMDDMSSMEGM